MHEERASLHLVKDEHNNEGSWSNWKKNTSKVHKYCLPFFSFLLFFGFSAALVFFSLEYTTMLRPRGNIR